MALLLFEVGAITKYLKIVLENGNFRFFVNKYVSDIVHCLQLLKCLLPSAVPRTKKKFFIAYKKFLHFCLTKNFVHFQNLKLAEKRLNSFTFLEIHHFFIVRITTTWYHCPNQRWLSFNFRPDNFTIVFLDILIIRIVNLRWLSLFLWFHHYTIRLPLHLELQFHRRS